MASADPVNKTVFMCMRDRRPPSHQSFYSGMHWSLRAQLARDWHEAVQLTMREYGIGAEPMTDCDITITCRMDGKVLDHCNVASKLLIDGMKRWQYTKAKGHFQKKSLPPGVVNFNEKRKMKRLENPRYLFEDDSYPHVLSVKSMVVPYDMDSIDILVEGLPVVK